MKYLLLEKKFIEKNKKTLVKLGQVKTVGNYEVVSNQLTFWIDKDIVGLAEAVEGEIYELVVNITQKGFDFKVYLNGLLPA